MAEVVAHSGISQANPPHAKLAQHTTTPSTAPHGTKRPAEGHSDNEQRLSKRFDLLNLVDNNGTRLYIPVPGSTDATLPRPPTSPITTPHPLATTLPLTKAPPRKPQLRPHTPSTSTGMEIEDTPHRVYIHDLAAELSDIESDEENPIFLADIEKHLSKIPKHVLVGPEPKATRHNQMVLYQVPASLSVPESQDGVRKAIVEARQRIRERQVSPLVGEVRVSDLQEGSARVGVAAANESEGLSLSDGEAMDID